VAQPSCLKEDGSVSLHQVMHVEADIIKVADSHVYAESLTSTISFSGYGCQNDVCNWFVDKANKDSTIMAHNGTGYDNKFSLKWCIDHGLYHDMIIGQGSIITYMFFGKNKIVQGSLIL
jgi:hypothetical protein